SKQKNNFILYPNPTQATIHILFQTPLSNEPAQLSIFDITGKLVLGQQFIADQHKPIDVGFLQPGIYYVSIETKNQTMRNKFIKMGAQ
ncbi:MAG TPA: T9SS type A sorting domain-containing protein, partial [Chitinophagaceae bacterium]|nr:T9SS type A sorting domain-containing protein [Chitinophagaceae bacterium]